MTRRAWAESRVERLRDQARELVDVGPRGLGFRLFWELRSRLERIAPALLLPQPREPIDLELGWEHRLFFTPPGAVAEAMRERIPPASLARLLACADDAVQGKITCFGARAVDFGDPPDWYLDPSTGKRWSETATSGEIFATTGRGDIKLVWEPARFPHSYHLSRAAAFSRENARGYEDAIARQILSFASLARPFKGVHWASGQEGVLRSQAWMFALRAALAGSASAPAVAHAAAKSVLATAQNIEHVIALSKNAVYNNHLICEALGLYEAAWLFPNAPEAARYRRAGLEILVEQATRQFDVDGGYIQRSHNYHRGVLQLYVWAVSIARSEGARVPDEWLKALDSSLDFLLAHQNASDGRLPNYGPNDGSLPCILSTCAHDDFRPTLQCVSLLVREKRAYDPGPWDEESAWLLGTRALDSPLQQAPPRSRSFPVSGFHVLRGERSFVAFRCGPVTTRFGQIDMLHADVWLHGLNIACDPGTYLYNGTAEEHAHFTRTAAHNTVVVDGLDQMVHHRKFTYVHWTRAELVEARSRWTITGEHVGYIRRAQVKHKRSIAMLDEDTFVVADMLSGLGEHDVRLHWQCGEFPYTADAAQGRITLHSERGDFTVAVFDENAHPLPATVVAGGEKPLRGWIATRYGTRVPAPSFAVERRSLMPWFFVSVIGAAPIDVRSIDGRLVIGRHAVRLVGGSLKVDDDPEPVGPS